MSGRHQIIKCDGGPYAELRHDDSEHYPSPPTPSIRMDGGRWHGYYELEERTVNRRRKQPDGKMKQVPIREIVYVWRGDSSSSPK
jgi:hypothetical protein